MPVSSPATVTFRLKFTNVPRPGPLTPRRFTLDETRERGGIRADPRYEDSRNCWRLLIRPVGREEKPDSQLWKRVRSFESTPSLHLTSWLISRKLNFQFALVTRSFVFFSFSSSRFVTEQRYFIALPIISCDYLGKKEEKLPENGIRNKARSNRKWMEDVYKGRIGTKRRKDWFFYFSGENIGISRIDVRRYRIFGFKPNSTWVSVNSLFGRGFY